MKSEEKSKDVEPNESVGSIWVLVDQSKGYLTFASKEMLQDASEAGRHQGIKVHAVLIGGEVENETWAEQVGSYGADLLIRVDLAGINHLTAEASAYVLDKLSIKYPKPYLMLIGGTIEGQEIAARLAIRWKTAYAHDCVSFSIKSNGIVEAIRSTHGEKLETIVSLTQRPAIVSFKPNSAGVGPKNEDCKAGETTFTIDLTGSRFDQNVLRTIPADPALVDIGETDFILACGHGVVDKEGFEILQELAVRLGASVAGTRRANDEGWIGIERRVGLTGKTVAPQIYMAVGISGAREHVVGMDDSKIIIAINKEPKAEIFRLAHKGFIGDSKEIMSSLLKKLKVADAS
ncbi:electron transfer flavoprotein subunit alpha/FixB family protein [Desulfosarcina widdelii]|nr:electron transfer flavoprotein subunit alpha/FixB family protein [Desulfosarcina widdelii]